jgi:N6-adenosine-specific RNA methylase IME4
MRFNDSACPRSSRASCRSLARVLPLKALRRELRDHPRRSALVVPGQRQRRQAGCGPQVPALSLPEICALDVRGIAAPNCLLALWWVPPMPEEALEVVRAWGFTLKTMKGFTWHKTTKHGKSHFGMGNWTRANTEDCLIAVRGKPKRANADVSQFVQAPRGRHSAKPDEVRERLVWLMGDVPRMFAGEAIPGGDVWGNEVESTIELGSTR